MGKLFKSSFFKLFLLSMLAVLALLLYFYSAELIPLQEKLLRVNEFDRVKTIFSLTAGDLTRAIASRDDITMLAKVENIMKIEDVSAVYILDNSCRVITHNTTSKWAKTYSDDTAKRAVETKSALRQSIPTGYLFSMPLTSSTTLCVGISSQKLEDSVTSSGRKVLFTALIIFILAAAAFFLFIYCMAYPSFKSLRDGLASLDLGGEAPPAR